tara:strand:- start:189 stop:398 length:210 start_codon:yes stop_codon:yes gene_type:complete
MQVVEVPLLMVKLVVMVDKVAAAVLVVDNLQLYHLMDMLLDLSPLVEVVVLDIRLLVLTLMLMVVPVLL